MDRSWIQSIDRSLDPIVKINGWIDTVRHLRKMWFILVRDLSGKVQVTYTAGQDPTLDAVVAQLTPESAVEIIGRIVANPSVKFRGIELIPQTITLVAPSQAELPIDLSSSQETRMDWRFLDLRRPDQALIAQIQATMERAMRDYWHKEHFLEIHSPKLMASPSESGAEVFRLEYYGGFAYLAQSPQFYKQMAMAAGFDRVFEIGPVFRANPSYTSRHETEFIGVDIEMSWITSHEDIMVFQERWLREAIQVVKQEWGEAIHQLFHLDVVVPEVPFPRITMKEAHRILEGLNHPLPDDEDLDAEGERLLSQYIADQYHHELAFITHFPTRVRPFYHMRPEANPSVTNSFDLLWKGLEVATGAQREHRYDILIRQAQEKGLSLDLIKDYLNYFKFGCPPHGGFGAGLARFLVSLLGLKNIREAVFLSRNPNRLTP